MNGEETDGILPIFVGHWLGRINTEPDSDRFGKVLLYDGFTGDLLNTFLPPSPQLNQSFGEAIDIDGEKLLVGSLSKDVDGVERVGEAYLYNWVTGELLQTFSNPNASEGDGFSNSLGIEGDTIFISARDDDFNSDNSGLIYVYEIGMGQTQDNPVLPSLFDPDTATYTFNDVISGQWFDPPFVDSFTYNITNPESLFTKILDFPTGFDDTFNVSVGGNDLGIFAPGETVDFVSLLGAGVKEFTVSGIDPLVDAEDALGFPIQLEFDTLRASFTQTPTVNIPQSTPEPTSILGFLGLGTWLLTSRKSKKLKGQS